MKDMPEHIPVWKKPKTISLRSFLHKVKKIAQIAEQFERTNGSVYSPLVKPGLIDEEEVQDAA